jgi:hypothetical protein
MEHVEPVRNQDKVTPTDTQLNSKMLFGLTLFFFAILELEFFRRLWALIGKHAPIDYIFNGLAFETCLVVSAISLWRCLRMTKTGEDAMRNYKDIMWRVTVLAMSLLLALMQFSSFTEAYDKIRP